MFVYGETRVAPTLDSRLRGAGSSDYAVAVPRQRAEVERRADYRDVQARQELVTRAPESVVRVGFTTA